MRAEIAAKPVVYRLPGMDSVDVRPNVPYSGGLRMDLYYPPEASSAPRPAVVIVLGYRDVEVPLPFGCQFREMEGNIGWARLFAASGMIGVAYETRDPSGDALAVLSHLRENAADLGIDPARIGIWSASGNVPVALSAIMQGASAARRFVMASPWTWKAPLLLRNHRRSSTSPIRLRAAALRTSRQKRRCCSPGPARISSRA